MEKTLDLKRTYVKRPPTQELMKVAHESILIAFARSRYSLAWRLASSSSTGRWSTSVSQFQESSCPFYQYTRGLEDMTNSPLQRGRQS